MSSVTRFVKTLTLWQYFKNLGQLCKGLLSVWQNFEPILANILCYWANFHRRKRPNTEQLI